MQPSRILAAALALALGVASQAQAQTQAAPMKTTMALPAIAFIFSTAYIAQDAGIFKAEGLDVKQQVITGIGSTNAVISGSVDFAFASGVTLTRAAARGQDLIGIANTYDHVGFWVAIKKSLADQRHFDPKASLAERAKVLKGLRIGVGAINAIPDAYLSVIAKAAGLNPETDLVVAGIAPPEQIGALTSNAIDGVSTGSPVIEQFVQSGQGVVIADGNMDPPSLAHIAANVLLTRRKLCADNKPLCMKMGQAMAKANAFMHDHPNQAMDILGKRFHVTNQAVLKAAYKHTLDATPNPPVLDAQELSAADDMNVAAGLMKPSEKLSSYDKIFTNEYVK